MPGCPVFRILASMKTLRALVAGLTCVLLACSAVRADETPRSISVTGEGEVKASPDLAIVSFAVETTAKHARDAVSENASKSQALAAAIKKKLKNGDKVTTTSYSLDPMYEQRERGSTAPPAISGYVARNEVRVELHAIDDVGTLIDIATQSGANRVNDLQFTLADRAPYLRQALEEAGHAAQEQAESVAKALGVKLKKVLSATTSTPPVTLPRRYRGVGMAMAEAQAPTPVEPGEVSVQATLNVTYEIE